MLAKNTSRLERHVAGDCAIARPRFDINGRRWREGDINVSGACLQFYVTDDIRRNCSVNRSARCVAHEFPRDLLQLEISTARFDLRVAGKITNLDPSPGGFCIESACSIRYGDVTAARFDPGRTATILNFDRSTAGVRVEDSL